MATEIVVTTKEVKLKDLDDYLMQKWLSKMSITEQTAVTRVCKRIQANAYRLTTFMSATDLPDDFRIEVIPKLPMLKKIDFLVYAQDMDVWMDSRLRFFLKNLAVQNPRIERIFGIPSKLKSYYVQMVRKHHKGYDGSTFKTLILEEHYEDLLEKFPSIKIRQRTVGFDTEMFRYKGRRTREERLSDPNLVALNVGTTMSNYNFNDILGMTKNLTDLWFQQLQAQAKPNFARIFDFVGNLPLKKFTIEVFPRTEGKIFGWVKRDFDSFKKLLELNSLVDLSLRFPQGNKTYLETLKCFLNCPRNNFHHFSSQALANDLSVSHFLEELREDRSQLDPTMLLRLNDHGNNDTFPIVQFIQKFSPKYREFQFKDRTTMVKMIKACTDLIKNQPKVHFVFYAKQNNRWKIVFRPFQLGKGTMNFSAEKIPTCDPVRTIIPANARHPGMNPLMNMLAMANRASLAQDDD